MPTRPGLYLLVLFAGGLSLATPPQAQEKEPARPPAHGLERLAYSHPGLAVDLGVGLWAWPLPMDFDGDGDLDLLCGEFLDGFTYFENVGTRAGPRYAPGRRLTTPDGKPLVMDLQMITPTAVDWDNDGDLDLVVGDEDGRVLERAREGASWKTPSPALTFPLAVRGEEVRIESTPEYFPRSGQDHFSFVSPPRQGTLF